MATKGRKRPQAQRSRHVKSYERTIQISSINVAAFAQKNMSSQVVDKIVQDFKEHCLGLLTLSKRSNGQLYVIDGQHRLAALIELGRSTVRCIIIEGLTPRQEAETILSMNTVRSKMSPQARFRNLLYSGDKTARRIQTMCEEYGFRTCGGGQEGSVLIGAINSLLRIAKRYDVAWETANGVIVECPDVDDVLAVIAAAWPDDKGAVQGSLIDAVALLMQKPEWQEKGDPDRLAKQLAGIDPQRLITEAAALSGTLRGSKPAAIRRNLLLKLYNKGWRSTQVSYIPEEDIYA